MKNPTEPFTISSIGKFHSGEDINQFRLINANGMEVVAINFGGIITSIKVPDKHGKMEDIVLGFESLESYFTDAHFIGALIGRYCNRIANGQLNIDGTLYPLATNNAPNHLHGGVNGFNKVVWSGEATNTRRGPGVKFKYLSKDMEEGYPGNLQVEVTYILTDENALEVHYKATTDKLTVVNLTQHSYFNLEGDRACDILEHELSLNADGFLPVDGSSIPLGYIQEVNNTPFDFRNPKPIGEDILDDHQQLKHGNGYDHCWALNGQKGELNTAAELFAPKSGRYMEVLTSEPGIQFYSGNYLDESIIGKGNVPYRQRSGLCLETGHFPNSPNQPGFPSTLLDPEETYESTTVYKFSTKGH